MEIDRAHWHDYREPGYYMITLSAHERKARPFATLVGETEAKANVQLTALGEVLRREILDQPRRHPEIELLQYVIMEDHCHILLHARNPMSDHLGKLVWGMKYGTTAAYLNDMCARTGRTCRIEGSRPSLDARNSSKQEGVVDHDASAGAAEIAYVPPLWATGYNDRIVTRYGQITTLQRYIERNPGRLWAKRHSNRSYMTVCDAFLPLEISLAQRLKDFATYCDVHNGGKPVAASLKNPQWGYAGSYVALLGKFLRVRTQDAVRQVGLKLRMCGNRSLLDSGRPLVRVRISRSVTKEQFEAEAERLMQLCEREGAILISPFVSWSEKMVLRLARHNHYPHIVVDQTAMSSLYKPADATRSVLEQTLPAWWKTSPLAAQLSRIEERSDMQCAVQGEILIVCPWPDCPVYEKPSKPEMELMNELCAVMAEAKAPETPGQAK